MDPVESFGDVIRFAQRTLPETNKFCARGTSKFRKILQLFREILTRISRNLDERRAFSDLNKCPTSLRASATVQGLRSARWPSALITFLRATCRNSGSFAILKIRKI